MLVWKLFLIILFATEHCLSVTLPKTKAEKDVEMSGNTRPKTKDKKDVEMSGHKTIKIDLIKEKSINPVVTLEGMDDYERYHHILFSMILKIVRHRI